MIPISDKKSAPTKPRKKAFESLSVQGAQTDNTKRVPAETSRTTSATGLSTIKNSLNVQFCANYQGRFLSRLIVKNCGAGLIL